MGSTNRELKTRCSMRNSQWEIRLGDSLTLLIVLHHRAICIGHTLTPNRRCVVLLWVGCIPDVRQGVCAVLVNELSLVCANDKYTYNKPTPWPQTRSMVNDLLITAIENEGISCVNTGGHLQP